MTGKQQINNYRRFINFLKNELHKFQITPDEEWLRTATKCVDGLASTELRNLVSLQIRRKYGTFFTDSEMADKVLKSFRPKLTPDSVIYDPACGAGNLLIAIDNYLSDRNINLRNGQLLGTDIHEEFTEATKLRLLINDRLKYYPRFSSGLDSLLETSIQTKDALEQNEFYCKATHIILNPPFNLLKGGDDIGWSRGKVSAAALFVDKIIHFSNPGVQIMAILPDVLRSGSRYEKWRKVVNQKCNCSKIELLGQFDKHTDIDVFAIKLTKKRKAVFSSTQTNIQKPTNENERTIDEFFNVRVGPVVDYRDPHVGKLRGYVISKGLDGWTENKKTSLKRKHQGKAFKPPFVVVKRTSRKEDLPRAVATIINTPAPVYVDNHLILLQPKSGTLKDCYKALSILKSVQTSSWLNQKIRCRHLTVKVVSKIPLK